MATDEELKLSDTLRYYMKDTEAAKVCFAELHIGFQLQFDFDSLRQMSVLSKKRFAGFVVQKNAMSGKL